MKNSIALAFVLITAASSAQAAEWLLKLNRRATTAQVAQELRAAGRSVLSVEDMRFNGWYLVRTATEAVTRTEGLSLMSGSRAAYIEPNMRLHWYGAQPSPMNTHATEADPVFRPRSVGSGTDPMMSQQWALRDTGFLNVKNPQGSDKVVVAVIDTGVDYNHPDLGAAMWMNAGEAGAKASNGIDDDNNGYVDDFMGYDFVDNDNLPYDKTGFLGTGNPGHGTHCSGVIGAIRGNGYGIAGIASGVRIMPLRFLSHTGEGSTANAVRAVKYAIDNGAWVLSNSWGGPDDQDADSRILREIFADAAAKGRITVVAAGNESLNVDAKPLSAVPASYNFPNQLTVAATGQNGQIASFSNFGATLVHLGAPGVGILSTTPKERFKNMDGTSMAAPVVAGAVALYWSQHLQATAIDVRKAVLSSVTPTAALQGRTATGGRLNIEALMR